MTAKACPLSGRPMQAVFSATLLGKHHVQFFQCGECGILQSEQPYWLDEAYNQAVVPGDTGLLLRNIKNRTRTEPVFDALLGCRGRYLDLGGGYGVFARLMRDIGLDYYTHDPHCENILCPGFEPEPGFQADALTAFEVFEHLADPVAFLRDAFATYGCRTILFSTLLYPAPLPPSDWWYYNFDGAQHITFYRPATLDALARAFNARYYALGGDLHLITDQPLTRWTLLRLCNKRLRRLSRLYTQWRRRGCSRTQEDHCLLSSRLAGTAQALPPPQRTEP